MRIGKISIGIAAAALSTSIAIADTTYSTYGDQSYDSDGTTYSTYGNQTYGSDGDSYSTYGCVASAHMVPNDLIH